MEEVLIFGGAFDPPHSGHEQIVARLLESKQFSQIWLMPALNHPFDKAMSPGADRLAMLKLVFQYYPSKVVISEFELQQPRVSYAFETLTALSQKYPDKKFSFLIGADNLPQFHLWHKYRELLKNFTVYVYPRVNYGLGPLYEGMVVLRNLAPIAVSSTEIRKRVMKDESIKELVSPSVAQYIKRKRLYKPPKREYVKTAAWFRARSR